MMEGVRAPCSNCRFRLICPESEDRTFPPPPLLVVARRKRHWREGLTLIAAGTAILLVPFLMGLGISTFVPRDLSVAEVKPSPTPFLAGAPPSPKYIAEK